MADIPASNWDETDANNTTAAPDGAPEGMSPSGVNNVLRAHQGAIKRWYDWTIPKTTGGTSTAYTLSYTVTPGALVDGMTHLVQFNATCGASPTLNVNSLGATPLHYYVGTAWAAVSASMITANMILPVTYNSAAGTYRIVSWPQPVVTSAFVTAGGGATVEKSVNITSVTRTGAGKFTVVMTNAMPDVYYKVAGLSNVLSSVFSLQEDQNLGARTTTTFYLSTYGAQGSQYLDPTSFSFIVIP
jgi:hypothetical protein